jgi:hypothetical protein
MRLALQQEQQQQNVSTTWFEDYKVKNTKIDYVRGDLKKLKLVANKIKLVEKILKQELTIKYNQLVDQGKLDKNLFNTSKIRIYNIDLSSLFTEPLSCPASTILVPQRKLYDCEGLR